jgi:diguanylate cyclase (GGDEF)-like protein
VLRRADTPSAEYEAARLRARALTAQGLDAGAITQVRAAWSLADTHGWPHREDWLRAEFPAAFSARQNSAFGAAHRSAMRSQTRVGASHTELIGGYNPYAQRLAALEQISLAASRVLDPTELTRIALDEAIRILGAERAYLFLTDTTAVESEQPDRLLPHLGRDADGADIDVLTGYGSTLIEGVRLSREPLVVTGTDEGAALGSQSAVMYGLRSIMVAPLLLDGRLLGVIYLDSRVAKGMFTSSDVGILTAITNHVAAALETARAAQLAAAVHAAEQQRDVADTIRHALAEVTATLDPADVLARLAATLWTSLTGHDARLVQRSGDKLILTDLADPTTQVNLATDAHPDLNALMLSQTPIRSGPGVTLAAIFTDPTTGCGLRSPESWLAIPLHVRDESVGLVLVGSAHPAGYTETEIDIADALTGQGMVAYDNARLFAQVKQLATTDELTGIFNRRQFFLLAHRELAVARRRDLRLAAVMVDIDHFKKVNDTHGHHTGDQVIRTVARRLTDAIRGTDILGRYGGEEFALILPDVGDSALAIAERLRAAIATSPVDTDAGPLPITISVGVAHLTEADGDAEILLANADKALYTAKKGGRNRVILHHLETAEGQEA